MITNVINKLNISFSEYSAFLEMIIYCMSILLIPLVTFRVINWKPDANPFCANGTRMRRDLG
jgi:hypothetical protein